MDGSDVRSDRATSLWITQREAREALVEVKRLREALAEAVDLLDNARSEFRDPALRRRWGQRRKALRSDITALPPDGGAA